MHLNSVVSIEFTNTFRDHSLGFENYQFQIIRKVDNVDNVKHKLLEKD